MKSKNIFPLMGGFFFLVSSLKNSTEKHHCSVLAQCFFTSKVFGADSVNRTHNLMITSQAHCLLCYVCMYSRVFIRRSAIGIERNDYIFK